MRRPNRSVSQVAPEGLTGTQELLAGSPLSVQTYERIREAIFSRQFEPGSRMKLQHLADLYDVSLTAVREALARLQSEGLVTLRPHVGYSVVGLSVERLLELTEARVGLESLAIQAAIEKGDVAWESEVLASHHRMASQPMFVEGSLAISDSWAECHKDFHETIAEGCRNRYVLAARSALYDESELYRRWSMPASTGDRDVAAEHKEIMRAVLDRDSERATSLMSEHIWRTTTVIVDASSRWPIQD